MPEMNSQFEHGRIPLKPLAYDNKDIAQCNELVVDYGESGSYHIYIVDSNDNTKLIDLTAINRTALESDTTADEMQITLDGIDTPALLKTVINFLYQNFVYQDNSDGFSVERDLSKVNNGTSILLKDVNNNILLPVTSVENVIDSSGVSVKERLDNITKVSFNVVYLTATEDNQSIFEFEYPYENYSDFIEVRVNGEYINSNEYHIRNITDDENNYTSAIITLSSGVALNSKVDILFLYNSTINSTAKPNTINGTSIANYSIPTTKLVKVSDSYSLNDPTCVASSAAVFNLYNDISSLLSRNGDAAIWGVDNSTLDNVISISVDKDFKNMYPLILSIITSNPKKSTAILRLNHLNSDDPYIYNLNIKHLDGSNLTRGIPANKVISLLAYPNNLVAYIISENNGLKSSRYIHKCTDQETEISYANLNYTIGDTIHVFRNGGRLFADLDYSIDTVAEKINLFVRTEDGETIVFEALNTY